MAIPIVSGWLRKIKKFNRWTAKYIKSHAGGKQHSKCSYYLTFFWAYFVKHIGLDELGYYHYIDLSPEERKHLVPRRENLRFIRAVNNVTDTSVLSDKMKCYAHFKDYYKRDVLAVAPKDVKSKESKDAFVDFVHRHGVIIIKPMSECEGKGVQAIDATRHSEEELRAISEGYTEGYLAEERVEQSAFMAAIHPESVNTIRINTVRYGSDVEVLWPSWRVGQGKAVVDNYSAGGISLPIDKDSGTTLCAISKNGTHFTTHPDTGVQLVGIQIPRWDELCRQVKQMALRLTDVVFVGWDMALTDNGWVMIEANYEPDNKAWQMTSKQGIRKDFEEMKRRLKVK